MSTQPYAPGLAPAVPAKKKPGLFGVLVGIVLIVGGVITAGVIIGTAVMGPLNQVSAAPVFQGDGTSHQVSLTAGAPSAIWATLGATGTCELTDPSGKDVHLAGTGLVSGTVDNFGSMLTFTPSVSGTYTVACQGTPVFPYKVAPANTNLMSSRDVTGILIGVGAFLVGVVVLIVALVRRSSWTKKYGPKAGYRPGATPYPVQPPQAYGAPPPQPYGQPMPVVPPTPYGQQPPAYGQQPPASALDHPPTS